MIETQNTSCHFKRYIKLYYIFTKNFDSDFRPNQI